MSQIFNSHSQLGELLIHEDDIQFTRESKEITNSSGAVMELEVGYPMDDNVPVVSGGEAGTDGLLLTKVYLEDGESIKVPVLARGPAVVNSDKIPTTDYAGDAITVATVVTALAGLDNIVTRTEPDTMTTQTT